ncbi:MAG: NDP-sugar synthase [Alphaproteobacteria bacterium]|nr:NDP-sugar synthase [Alphaproteobacteria bacterium]
MPASAFVLAAGFGTRLRPLTLDRPKPLVPVCGEPLLAYALALCRRHGLTEVLVNAHWLHEQLVAWEGEHDGVRVHVVVEQPEILGTGGGLKAVRDRLAERVAILNGDVLHDVDLTALLERVPEGGGALVLRPHPEDADRYGHVSADSTGTVVQMRDFASTEPVGPVQHDTHFTGIHALHRDLLDDAVDGFSDILRTAHKARIGRRLVQGVRYHGPWLDIGDPEAYLATNLAVLRGEVRLPLDPRDASAPVPPGVTVRGRAWIGEGASIAPGAVLEDTIVGRGATVGPVELVRTVVWDGVTVDEPLVDAVAHDSGIWS